MKTTLSLIISLLLVSFTIAQESALKGHVKSLTDELETSYPENRLLHLAVLDFRTADNRLTLFNTYLQNAFQTNYKGSKVFRLIDQNNINRVVENSSWDLEKSNDFETYATLREEIFKNLGLGADAFIYGQINDNIETITITVYLIPQGVKPSRIHASVTFPSDEETDRLLGKPVVRRPKRPKPKDTVVIVRDRVIDREVRVVDTVFVEREVLVEKPVVIQNKTEKPSERVVIMHGYRFELASITRIHDGSLLCNIMITRIQDDMELNLYRSLDRDRTTRLYDENGAEYTPESLNVANKPSNRSYNNHRFVQDVPTPVTMQVGEVNKNVNLIKLVEFVAGDSSHDQFKVQFRNIAID